MTYQSNDLHDTATRSNWKVGSNSSIVLLRVLYKRSCTAPRKAADVNFQFSRTLILNESLILFNNLPQSRYTKIWKSFWINILPMLSKSVPSFLPKPWCMRSYKIVRARGIENGDYSRKTFLYCVDLWSWQLYSRTHAIPALRAETLAN